MLGKLLWKLWKCNWNLIIKFSSHFDNMWMGFLIVVAFSWRQCGITKWNWDWIFYVLMRYFWFHNLIEITWNHWNNVKYLFFHDKKNWFKKRFHYNLVKICSNFMRILTDYALKILFQVILRSSHNSFMIPWFQSIAIFLNCDFFLVKRKNDYTEHNILLFWSNFKA